MATGPRFEIHLRFSIMDELDDIENKIDSKRNKVCVLDHKEEELYTVINMGFIFLKIIKDSTTTEEGNSGDLS